MRIATTFNVLILGLIFSSGCADLRKSASIHLRTPVPCNAVVVKGVDDEDWFWCVLQLTPEESSTFSRTVQASNGWHAMPLTPELMSAAEYLQPVTSEFKGHIPISNTNGFYTLIDMEAEFVTAHPYPGSTAKTQEPFQKRGGLNFVFGYFDDIERKIYVWWCHT